MAVIRELRRKGVYLYRSPKYVEVQTIQYSMMTPELQPVIFAAGEGSKMFPLTEDIPKCLLPIGNVPMICYVVHYLEKYGFREFIVILRSSDVHKVGQVLKTGCDETSKFDFVTIPDEDDYGTADSLRLVNDKIKKDILILSCDMLTDAPLNRLVDIHRTYDSSLTLMLSKRVELQAEKEKSVSSKGKQKDPHSGIRDFTCIDAKEKRLLLFTNEGDLEHDNMTIKKTALKMYPNMKVNTELVDCHLYIMKKWLVEYLTNYEKPESIKSDFIPHVVQKQFSKAKKDIMNTEASFLNGDNEKNVKDLKDIHSYVTVDEMTMQAQKWSGYQGRCLKDKIKCHAYTTDSFCLRVNTLPTYTHINRQISKLKESLAPKLDFTSVHPTVVQTGKSQIGNDCMLGEYSTLNSNVTVKKSVIGKRCVIGSNIRIINCIIMNHVTIGDGCVLQGCIICDNSVIQMDSTLVNCHVSSNQTVKEKSELKDETIVEEEMEFDE